MRPGNRRRFDAGDGARHNWGDRRSETFNETGGPPMMMNALTITVLTLALAKNERRRRFP